MTNGIIIRTFTLSTHALICFVLCLLQWLFYGVCVWTGQDCVSHRQDNTGKRRGRTQVMWRWRNKVRYNYIPCDHYITFGCSDWSALFVFVSVRTLTFWTKTVILVGQVRLPMVVRDAPHVPRPFLPRPQHPFPPSWACRWVDVCVPPPHVCVCVLCADEPWGE